MLRLGDKKLFLVGRLVYEADERNFCICDGVCFLDFAHAFSHLLSTPLGRASNGRLLVLASALKERNVKGLAAYILKR